jgi:hypothetical protein
MVVPWINPRIGSSVPCKTGIQQCLCLHNAYYITYQVLCQINAKIDKYQVNIKSYKHILEHEKDTTINITRITENIIDVAYKVFYI